MNRSPVASPPDLRPTDIRRLVAALLSAVIPGLGQAVNGRFRLARWLLIPALVLVPLSIIARQLFSPVRLAAWAINPAVLQTLLVLNVVVLVWRLIAVAQAFFDGRYPAVPGRLGFAGLVVVTLLVMAPHAYAWQVGSAADKAFARVFEGGTLGDGGEAIGPVPGSGERINILLVGVDATPKRSATLTDTMMVISLDPVGKTASMVSIPRDLVFVPLGNGDDYGPKINSLLGYAERNPGDVPERADARAAGRDRRAARASRSTTTPGSTSRASSTWSTRSAASTSRVKGDMEDPSYDGYGIGERGWSITKGRHRLDGVNALAYARVRKAAGESDFTRAARQQEILVALRTPCRRDDAAVRSPDAARPRSATRSGPTSRSPLAGPGGASKTWTATASPARVIRHPLVRTESTRYGDVAGPEARRDPGDGRRTLPGAGRRPAESPDRRPRRPSAQRTPAEHRSRPGGGRTRTGRRGDSNRSSSVLAGRRSARAARGRRFEDGRGSRAGRTPRHRAVEPAQQVVPVAAHVEQPDRLRVQAELGPRHDLGQLLERAEAAGQRDERVGQLGHDRLALVERGDDAQLGRPGWASSRSTRPWG